MLSHILTRTVRSPLLQRLTVSLTMETSGIRSYRSLVYFSVPHFVPMNPSELTLYGIRDVGLYGPLATFREMVRNTSASGGRPRPELCHGVVRAHSA